jgi:hypothetical protein
MTGIVGKCSLAEQKAAGGSDPSRVVTVSVQNQAGQTVASQRLPLRDVGSPLPHEAAAGTYWISVFINAISPEGVSAGDTVYVPADMTNEEDFDDATLMCVG